MNLPRNGQELSARQEIFFQTHSLGTLLLRPPRRIVPPYSWIGHLAFSNTLVRLQQPRVFVELGTHTGNSFCGFCQAVKQEGLGTQCYAVDTWQGDANAGYYGDSVYQELASYVGSEYDDFAQLLRMTFDKALENFQDGSIDLLHIDGLHTYEAVRHDFESWKAKLSSRAVVLFHDTRVMDRGFGVNQYWSELCEQYRSYEFLHSHGLGVLLVGDDVAPLVSEFIDLTIEDPKPIQAVFERISMLGLDSEVVKYQNRFGSTEAVKNVLPVLYCELYLDYGQGFSDNEKLIAQLPLTQSNCHGVYELGQHASGLLRFRFDPGVEEIALRKISVRGRGSDGQWQALESVSDAAIYDEPEFTLFKMDPWLEYTVPPDGLDAIEFDIEIAAMGVELIKALIERIPKMTALEHELDNANAEIRNANEEIRRITTSRIYRLLTLVRLLPNVQIKSGK